MGRTFYLFILFVLLLPTGVQASSWHSYTSRQYGFSLRYPTTWTLNTGYQPGSWQLTPAGSTAHYQLSIAVLPIKPGHSLNDLEQRFVGYARVSGNPDLARVRWYAASLGSRPAIAGVLRLATEGGTSVTNGYYVAASRARVFEITMVDLARAAPASVAQFPAIYGKIVASWRFR